ncbi:ADP ribosylation factor family GTPase [Entamoeba marina]
MGGWISKLISRKEYEIIMVGLDNAGKTTILYNLKFGEPVTTIPTIGMNHETIRIKNVTFSVLDLGGQSKIRPLWRHYYDSCKAIVFVVDVSDYERITESAMELHKILRNESLKQCSLLVLGNKTDVDFSMNEEEFSKRLGINGSQRKIHVEMISALKNQKVKDGFIWLSNNIS